ncbi:hypothetical protein ACPCBX_03400 [Streptomyces tuirus]|uniref:Uncharacterized protein n=1 Tax=Streptomyces tuirus TaxID=68278 RepID=A0A7G1NRG7_9ACTN|nr:hypothetical protein [Streptomyces tuirus]BCL24146.1 hypothetical protein GCM10017668_59890 [Streptomyces tuirus]
MTPAEERVRGAFPRGRDVDLRNPADETPARDAAWGADRRLPVALLRPGAHGLDPRHHRHTGITRTVSRQ